MVCVSQAHQHLALKLAAGLAHLHKSQRLCRSRPGPLEHFQEPARPAALALMLSCGFPSLHSERPPRRAAIPDVNVGRKAIGGRSDSCAAPQRACRVPHTCSICHMLLSSKIQRAQCLHGMLSTPAAHRDGEGVAVQLLAGGGVWHGGLQLGALLAHALLGAGLQDGSSIELDHDVLASAGLHAALLSRHEAW